MKNSAEDGKKVLEEASSRKNEENKKKRRWNKHMRDICIYIHVYMCVLALAREYLYFTAVQEGPFCESNKTYNPARFNSKLCQVSFCSSTAPWSSLCTVKVETSSALRARYRYVGSRRAGGSLREWILRKIRLPS